MKFEEKMEKNERKKKKRKEEKHMAKGWSPRIHVKHLTQRMYYI